MDGEINFRNKTMQLSVGFVLFISFLDVFVLVLCIIKEMLITFFTQPTKNDTTSVLYYTIIAFSVISLYSMPDAALMLVVINCT